METTMHKLIVMGASGCGKSTLAAGVALALGCPLIEGDDFHLPESRAKMRQGVALQDSDREPWLDRLGLLMADPSGATVATCSALKRRYRDRLRAQAPGLRLVFIDISEADAAHRVRSRPGHLFPASLVASQFAALESPVGEPGVLRVDAALALQAQLDVVIRWLASPITSPPYETSHA
jgi:gluconokinase